MFEPTMPVPESGAAVAEERRAAVRFVCAEPASCSAPPAPRRLGATVRDLCPVGVGLLLARSFARGTSLIVELQDRAGGVVDVAARVIYALRHSRARWTVGCEFDTPLTDDELHALL